MPIPEKIIQMIDQREANRSALLARMDRDFGLYNLEPYLGETDANGKPLLDNYKKFTSNDPRTMMNLALHLGSTARLILRVKKPKAQKEQRIIDNDKELFGLGILGAANDRREDLMVPCIQDSLFGMAHIRGRTAMRVLLVKEKTDEVPEDIEQALGEIEALPIPDEDRGVLETTIRELSPQTRTFVDVQDWDPRNTYWAMGKHGLRWACHKSWKTAEDIFAEFGVKLEGEDVEGEEDQTRLFAVYDWLDETHNQVVMDTIQVLKKRTPHGMGRVPADIRMVGTIPLFQANFQHGISADGFNTGSQKDFEVHYGESFYSSSRAMFAQQNFILSILAELSKRSIAQGLKVFSADGSKSLDADPRETGAESALKTGQEDIVPIPPMEMIKEAATLQGTIAQMVQRGTFPASVFGELAFQLSGFAVKLLQQGQESPIGPATKTVATAIRGILNILAGAYVSGNFDLMTLSGRMQDVGGTDFEQEFPIDKVKAGGLFEVELVPQLPQDDQSKAVLAQTLAAGPVPLADMRFIRENVLMFQDVEAVERAVQEQLAKTGSPAALAFSNMLAAAESGDMELAQTWLIDLQIIMMQQMLQMNQLRMMGAQIQGGPGQLGGQPGGQQNGASPRGMSSAALPAPMQGIPTPEPTPQAGPIAAPGIPRPSRR